MADYTLYFATNRNHEGKDRWNPSGYGTRFSDDGPENLRFGKLTVQADANKVARFLEQAGIYGVGNGIALAGYLSAQAKKATITAYLEDIPRKDIAEIHQENVVLGSKAMFNDLMQIMKDSSDVLIYIHGFNVSWNDAVGSALALQSRLNSTPLRDSSQNVIVVLFSWPSDGQAIPFVSYKSDRTECAASGSAFARGILKLRDYLMAVCKLGVNPCGQDIHLLCHSMGNFALQNALPRIADFSGGRAMPRIFEHIFMCAPDVDADCFEDGKPLARLPELCRNVTVYYNRQDKAMYVSDYTKGNPERLGCDGASRPALLNSKINIVDCTPVVKGEDLTEHSYYLVGHVNDDIRLSTDGIEFDDQRRRRKKKGDWPNLWEMI